MSDLRGRFSYLQQATSTVRTVSIHYLKTHTLVLIDINIAYMIQS